MSSQQAAKPSCSISVATLRQYPFPNLPKTDLTFLFWPTLWPSTGSYTPLTTSCHFPFQVFRVYYDRLVDSADCSWLFEFTRDETKKSLGVEFNTLFQHLDTKATGKITEDNLRSLICCDFSDTKNDTKPYIEVTDLDNLRKVVEGYLDEFNNMSKKPMNLVLFR